jgi:hypothetical protein
MHRLLSDLKRLAQLLDRYHKTLLTSEANEDRRRTSCGKYSIFNNVIIDFLIRARPWEAPVSAPFPAAKATGAAAAPEPASPPSSYPLSYCIYCDVISASFIIVRNIGCSVAIDCFFLLLSCVLHWNFRILNSSSRKYTFV